MGAFQWLFDYWKYPVVKCWTKGVDFAKNTGAWIHQQRNQYPCKTLARNTAAWFKRKHNENPWICFLVKRVGVALTIIAGFYGLYLTSQGNQLAREGNHATMQSNILASKTLCLQSFQNLTETDQRSCNKLFRVDVITSVHELIVESGVAITSWLHAKYIALASFCGIHSIAERSSDTCISLGLFLGFWLLGRGHLLKQDFGRNLLDAMVAISAAIVAVIDDSVATIARSACANSELIVLQYVAFLLVFMSSWMFGRRLKPWLCEMQNHCLLFHAFLVYIPLVRGTPIEGSPNANTPGIRAIEGFFERDEEAMAIWWLSLMSVGLNISHRSHGQLQFLIEQTKPDGIPPGFSIE